MKYLQKTDRQSGQAVDERKRRERIIMQMATQSCWLVACGPGTQCTVIDPNPVSADVYSMASPTQAVQGITIMGIDKCIAPETQIVMECRSA